MALKCLKKDAEINCSDEKMICIFLFSLTTRVVIVSGCVALPLTPPSPPTLCPIHPAAAEAAAISVCFIINN